MGDLHVYEDDCGCDKIVAESTEEALALWFECTGEKPSDYPGKVFFLVPDETVIRIYTDGCAPTVGRQAKYWAADEGKGFLCFTEC